MSNPAKLPRLNQLVLTVSRRAAVVIRLDNKTGEATVRRLDDGALVSFRTSMLEPLADGFLILSARDSPPTIGQDTVAPEECRLVKEGE